MTFINEEKAVEKAPRKLGRLPVKHDLRTLKLASYVKPKALPVPPAVENWGAKVAEWGMMVNDQLGDCTCAAVGHLILMHTSCRGAPWRPTDAEVVEMYHNVSGYIPGRPGTDNGANELDVLNYWRKTGIGGHKIVAFVSINPKDLDMLKTAIYLFGGVYTGVSLPLAAENKKEWIVGGEGLTGKGTPGSWGGHAVPLVGYDSVKKTALCVTWGELLVMTEEWWLAYGDEAYAVITEDWVPPKGVSPSNFNLAQLQADLLEVTNHKGVQE